MPMQPRPRADTSRLLFPNLRFCIVSTPEEFAPVSCVVFGRCAIPTLDAGVYPERYADGADVPAERAIFCVYVRYEAKAWCVRCWILHRFTAS